MQKLLGVKSELQGTPLKNNYLLNALQCFSSKAASKKKKKCEPEENKEEYSKEQRVNFKSE